MILRSTDPASGALVWEGEAAGPSACAAAVDRARAAFAAWRSVELEERVALVEAYGKLLDRQKDGLAELISRETGKPLWEARAEVASMIGKIALSIAALHERAGSKVIPTDFGRAVLQHRPHGVMAVLGPFNFPGHLPNGHIVPALLAGNCVVFKPSEQTPAVGEQMVALLREAGIPPGVIELVQGGRDSGAALLDCRIDGLLFTGSAAAGQILRRRFVERPEVILALELGGNNPLIAWDGDLGAIAEIIAQSAFLSAGQRCSCARRLIVPDGARGEAMIEAALARAESLRIGAWNDEEEPFMGPLIAEAAAGAALASEAALLRLGARPLRRLARVDGRSAAFVSPGLIDATGCTLPDEEVFAPLLTVYRVRDFDQALDVAGATRFGLSAGIITDDDTHWQLFHERTRAGVVNRNRPTTGASSALPFGGIGESGNHRPSAFYAADYCAYPVASLVAETVAAPAPASPVKS